MTTPGPDVIVIGGGIVGCAAAYFLAQQGHAVTLIEKDSVAAHASGFAFGVLLPQLLKEQPRPIDRLTGRSLELHRKIASELAADGFANLRRERSAVLLALNEVDADQYRRLYRAGTSFVGDVRWLESGELSHIEARISPDIPGGLYMGDSAEISPGQFTNTLWQAAERRGAKTVHAEVASVSEGSRGVTVRAGGEDYSAARVIVAAGPWSTRLLEGVGLNVLVEPLKGQIVRLRAPGPEMRVSLWWGGDYAGSKPDGLLWCGTTEESVGFDEQPTDNARYGILSSANRVLPFLKDAEVAQQTACLRPVTADGLPVVGTVPGAGNIIVSTGGGRNGIVLGPALGEVAAELASSRRPTVDVSSLGPSRFTA